MECCNVKLCYNDFMSSNDRYRGNREYRDLTVQTHYGKSGRQTRVQTKRPFDADMKFSQNSVDSRRPYEDREFIERSRASQAQQRPQQRPTQAPNYQNDPRQYYQPRQQAPQQQAPAQQMPYGQYVQPQPYQPQQQYQQPQPKRVDKPEEYDMRRLNRDSKSKGNGEVAANMGPKVSKEQVMQIDMVFKICIMVWAAAALVTTIVLLTR